MSVDPYGLLLPGTRASMEREAELERARKHRPLLHALQQLDPDIVDLVRIGPRAVEQGGIKPGRWHVHRRNKPPAPDSFIPIETPGGGYREPDFGVLAELRERDLHRPGALERVLTKQAPAGQEKPKRDDRRIEDIAHHVRNARRLPGENLHKRKRGKK